MTCKNPAWLLVAGIILAYDSRKMLSLANWNLKAGSTQVQSKDNYII
jgi:hypothetical protein